MPDFIPPLDVIRRSQAVEVTDRRNTSRGFIRNRPGIAVLT
jgi:hypothetical protein